MIIDAKGEYLTRSGKLVIINEIDENPDTTVMSFKCKGHIRHQKEGKRDKFEWNIWHRSGAFTGFPGNDLDIVSVV